MEFSTNNVKTIRKSKRYFLRQSIYLSVAALLTYSSFIGVVCLQSSINIAEELGTTCLAVCYGTAMLCNAAFTPTLLQLFGPKRSLIFSDVFYILYTLANIYPSFPTLIIASVFLGVAQAISWSDFPKYFEHFGKEYAKLAAATQEIEEKDDLKKQNSKSFKDYVCRFAGRFYSILNIYLVIGNMSSYIILRLIGDLNDDHSDINGTIVNTTIFPNTTALTPVGVTDVIPFIHDYSFCGSNQCSAADVTSTEVQADDEEFHKYVIKSWTLQLYLFIFYAVIQVLALLMHIFLLNDPISKTKQMKKCDNKNNNLEDKSSDFSTCNESKLLTTEDETTGKEKKRANIITNTLATLRHLKDPMQLLLLPANIHMGLALGFIFGDLTRSFISCISGVQQVGIMLSVFGVSAIITGFVLERLGVRFGRNTFMAISYTFELINLLVCLFWQPSADSWAPWFLLIGFGISDGLREPLIGATTIEHFSWKGDVAYSTLGILTGLGSSLAYLSSRFLCVNVKIYILLSTLTVSAVGYVIAEMMFRRRFRRSNISSE